MTTTTMLFCPTFSAIGEVAEPDTKAVPLTVTVELAMVGVGITVTDQTALGTEALYVTVADANTGDSVMDPDGPFNSRFERVASDDGAA